MFVSPLRGWKPEPSQRKYCVFSPAGYEIVRLDVERWGYAIYLKQGESQRDAKLDPVLEDAYASVCLAILNLDEALTRE